MIKSRQAIVTKRLEEFQKSCRTLGLKVTQQRLEIFREVAGSDEHPDAEAVFKGVRQRLPTISLDTVYRTLWTLMDIGVLDDLGPGFRRIRFDANTRPHHHFICLSCGRVEDFSHEAFDRLEVPDGVKEKGKIRRMRVECRGICNECEKAQEAANTPQALPKSSPSPCPTRKSRLRDF
jgi:Fur family peroxide stress response transcriptional regulator